MSELSIPQIIELADGTKCVRLEDFLREREETPWGANNETKESWFERQRAKFRYLETELEDTRQERDNWEQTAAHYLEGMHYYQGLVERIGDTIGEAAYIQDDGGKVDSVLCAKVPELVEELKREREEAREALEAVNALEEMHAKPGSMEIAIKQNPAQAQWVAKCFASMVAASPNYTEMKFDLVAKEEKWEWLTVLIQKGNGQTPHQLRQKAENERDEAREDLEFRRGLYKVQEEYLETARRERDEAREEVARLRESLRCLLNPQCDAEEAEQ